MANQAWPELTGEIEDKVWNRFRSECAFRPSMAPADWPGIVEPTPSVTYSVADVYGDNFWGHIKDIHIKALGAFRKCVPVGQKLYVLDWHHPSYLFDPHTPFDAQLFDEWRVPVFPDGDYYIFLAEDFSYGTFGHPWEATLCVFGQALITEFENNRPSSLRIIRRK